MGINKLWTDKERNQADALIEKTKNIVKEFPIEKRIQSLVKAADSFGLEVIKMDLKDTDGQIYVYETKA